MQVREGRRLFGLSMGYPKGSANAGEKNEERNKIPEMVGIWVGRIMRKYSKVANGLLAVHVDP